MGKKLSLNERILQNASKVKMKKEQEASVENLLGRIEESEKADKPVEDAPKTKTVKRDINQGQQASYNILSKSILRKNADVAKSIREAKSQEYDEILRNEFPEGHKIPKEEADRKYGELIKRQEAETQDEFRKQIPEYDSLYRRFHEIEVEIDYEAQDNQAEKQRNLIKDSLYTADQDATSIDYALDKTPLEEKDRINKRLKAEENAKVAHYEKQLTANYGNDVLYRDILFEGKEHKKAHGNVVKTVIDKGSADYGFDKYVNELKSVSPNITDYDARKMSFNKFYEFAYSYMNTNEKKIADTLTDIAKLQKEVEADPSDFDKADKLMALKFELQRARGDKYKKLIGEDGDFVNKDWHTFDDSDVEDIKRLEREYSSWTPERLGDLWLQTASQLRYLSSVSDEIDNKHKTNIPAGGSVGYLYAPARDFSIPYHERLNEHVYPIYKKFKALTHALLLNQDPASIKTNLLQFFGRGLASGLGVDKVLTTESEMQEFYNQAVTEGGGQITDDQFEAASRTILQQSSMAIGNSIPIMAEMMATGGLIKGATTALKLSRRADRLVALSRKLFGRTGQGFARTMVTFSKEPIKSGLIFGLTPDERITTEMGIGEGLAQTLLNFTFKGKNVGKLGEFLTRTIVGTNAETVAEFSGEFARNMKENGFDAELALEQTFGSTKDEVIDRILVTAMTCAVFSSGANANVLFKLKSAIETQPDSEARTQGLETINEMIADTEASQNPGVSTTVSSLVDAANTAESSGIEIDPLSVTTDETIQDIDQGATPLKENMEQARQELQEFRTKLDNQADKINEEGDDAQISAFNELNKKVNESLNKVESKMTQQEGVKDAGEVEKADKAPVPEAEVEQEGMQPDDVRDTEEGRVEAKKEEDQEVEPEVTDEPTFDMRFELTTEELGYTPEGAKVDKKTGIQLSEITPTPEENVVDIDLGVGQSKAELSKITNALDKQGIDSRVELPGDIYEANKAKYEEQGFEFTKQGDDFIGTRKAEPVAAPEVQTTPDVAVTPEVQPTTEAEQEIIDEPDVEPDVKDSRANQERRGNASALAQKGSSIISQAGITDANLADVEQNIQDTTNIIKKGLPYSGADVKSLINDAVSLGRRIARVKKRGVEADVNETQKIRDLLDKYYQKVQKVVERSEAIEKKKVSERAIKKVRTLMKRSIDTKAGRKVGTRETQVAEAYNTINNALSGKIDINDAFSDIQDVLVNPDNYSDDVIDNAIGITTARELILGHKDWGLNDWIDFENKIKDIDKESRRRVSELKKQLKEGRDELRSKIDANVDPKASPLTEGQTSQDAARTIGEKLKKYIPFVGGKAQKGFDVRNRLTAQMLNSSGHVGTIFSLFDKNEATAQSGVLFSETVGRIERAFSNKQKGAADQMAKFRDLVASKLDPEAYKNLRKKIKEGNKSLKYSDTKMKELYQDLIDSKILNGRALRTKIEGEEYVIPVSDQMTMYAYSLDPNLRQEQINMGITDEMISSVKENMGPEVVSLVEATISDFNTKQYDRINKVYRKLYLTNLQRVNNYFPIKRSGLEFGAEIGSENINSSTLAFSNSLTKARTKTGKPLQIISNGGGGFIDIMTNHIHDSEHFIAMGEVIRHVNTVMSTKSLRQVLRHYGLYNTVMKNLTHAIGGQTNNSGNEFLKVLDNLYKKYGMTVLGGRLIQIPKQASSFIQAYPEYAEHAGPLPLPRFLAGAVWNAMPGRFQGRVRFHYETSPLFRNRVNSLLMGMDITSIGDIKDWKKLNAFQKFNEFMRKPTKYGDMYGVILGYTQVYDAVLAKTGSAEKANEAFEKYDQTQQTKNPLFMTAVQLSGNPVLRAMTSFRSSQILMLNQSIASAHAIRRGFKKGGFKGIPKKDVRNLIINWSVTNMMFQAVTSGLGAWFREDDKDFYKDMVRAGILGPINGLFIVGSIIEWMYDIAEGILVDGKPPKLRDIKTTIELEKSVNKAIKPLLDDPTEQENIIRAVGYTLELGGLPVNTIKRTTEDAFIKATGEDLDGYLEEAENAEELILKTIGLTDYQIKGDKKRSRKKSTPSF